MLLAANGSGCVRPALAGVPETLWIGGTASQKDSKHRQLRAAVPDTRTRPPHAVRILLSVFCMGIQLLLIAVCVQVLRDPATR